MTTDETVSVIAPGRRRRNPVLTFLKDVVIVIVGALVISAPVRTFVGQMFVIPSGSMENTLLPGDRVVVQKVTDVHRGEVVVFKDPAHWLPDEPGSRQTLVQRGLELVGIPTTSSPGHLVKRVVGTAGDTVVCCDAAGRITVNGTALDETDYLYAGPSGQRVAPSDVQFRVVVPREHLFVMGDHRDNSADSRAHFCDASADGVGQTAFVPLADVVGPAFAVIAPVDRAGLLGVPAAFADVPDPDHPAPEHGTIRTASGTCP